MREFLVNSSIDNIKFLFEQSFADKGAYIQCDHTITHTYFRNGDKVVDVEETQDNILTDYDPDFPELTPYICKAKRLDTDAESTQVSGLIPTAKKYQVLGYAQDLKATIHQVGICTPKNENNERELIFFREFDIDVDGEHLQMFTASFGEGMFHSIPADKNTYKTLNEALSKLSTGIKAMPLSFETDNMYDIASTLQRMNSPKLSV